MLHLQACLPSSWGLSHWPLGAFPAPHAGTPTDLVCLMGDLKAATTTVAKPHRDLRQLFQRQACMQAAHAIVLHYGCSKGYGRALLGNQFLFAAFRSETFMLLDVCGHLIHFSILIDTLPTASHIRCEILLV